MIVDKKGELQEKEEDLNLDRMFTEHITNVFYRFPDLTFKEIGQILGKSERRLYDYTTILNINWREIRNNSPYKKVDVKSYLNQKVLSIKKEKNLNDAIFKNTK